VVPPSPTPLRAKRRHKTSRRAGKNWPKRPPGISEEKPPEGTACVFMHSSSYNPVLRLFLTEVFDLTTRAILDTGSGPTLISRQLLPDDTQLQPLGEWASMLHDVNGGWLPNVGSVCLGAALGDQTSYTFFGVVDNMSVPAILSASFMDIAPRNIANQEQHVELLNGTKVPIRRDGARKGPPSASVSPVCACPQGGTAKLRPARKTWGKPGTITHIPVKGTCTGHGFVTGRPLLYHNHGIQVVQGPAIMAAGEPKNRPSDALGRYSLAPYNRYDRGVYRPL